MLGKEWTIYLDTELRRSMGGIGYRLNTSEQTPAESVEAIIESLS